MSKKQGECLGQRGCPGVHGRENDSVKVVESTPKSEVAEREESVQAFWVEHDIFNKSLETPAGAAPVGDFVFYDGPPFATGLPHYGHILAGTIKDAIPRFWTMNGYRVRRNWGWDCHGLPVENLIEKKLGLAAKKDIEDYGVQNFNEQAREAVMEYSDEWRKIIPRMGRFVDMEDDYKTMDTTYTESVWWVFKSLHDKGLVYEGFKSMHLCPRCGTTLSNFEVNQGYKDIKDLSVFVELPLVGEENTSLVIWTTTPWTLPGNMAAAVNSDFEYAVVERKSEEGEAKRFIVAKDRVKAVFGEEGYEIVEIRKGSELVDKKYNPPFDYLSNEDFDGKENAWTIYHADYVEIGEEGTGAVHIAPAYGDDDMKLAQENDVPIKHHVDEAGHFMDFVTDFAGLLVKPKDDKDAEINHMDADIEIIRALAAKGVLFGKEKITHSYPHCWRCDTPLLNYATTSWFIEVTKIKDDLVEANDKVNWVPGHVGKNRFGKWLDGARDWAVSRQRYWGAPLPIWKNPESGEYKIFGSLAELKQFVPKSQNEYVLMRHGESESNINGVISCNKDNVDGLTTLGKTQVEESASSLEGIDLIIHSGFQRTRETAEITAAKFEGVEVIEDDRIKELDLSDDYEGKSWDSYSEKFSNWSDRYTKVIKDIENRRDVQKRMGEFIHDLESKYSGKKILIVSHAGPLFGLECAVMGLNVEQSEFYFGEGKAYFGNAETRVQKFSAIPHNDNYELDFHRPYIDDVELFEGEVKLERVPDVFDCWFESGSMPYAQHHYPFENNEEFETKYFPANFIAEGLDQTRGWFYSLIVLGVALFGKAPFENVVVNGTVLAEDGNKMSKSLQNYPDPMDVAHTAGADAMRFYLLSSPGIKGEDFSFLEKEVNELQRKNVGRLHNVLSMFEMFADGTEAKNDSDNVLDRWIVSRLNQLVEETTFGYKNYELDKATRPVTDFIDDLSVWYLRRSRERLKGEDVEDKKLVIATLRHSLRTLALVMAPSMPFYAEYLWLAVKEDKDAESVHLAPWPEAGEVDLKVLEEMKQTREIVTSALEARTKANIKVRQPIAKVFGPALSEELIAVVLDEMNAKEYEEAEEIKIETDLTPELIAEGAVRELMRGVQGQRKSEGLEPHDEIELIVQTNEIGKAAVTSHNELLIKTVGAVSLEYGEVEADEIKLGEFTFKFSIKKI
jgi:isoleucyl-tRNA synthetase